MRQAIVVSIVLAMAVPIVAGAVLASNTWNAALKVQDNVSAFSLRGQHRFTLLPLAVSAIYLITVAAILVDTRRAVVTTEPRGKAGPTAVATAS